MQFPRWCLLLVYLISLSSCQTMQDVVEAKSKREGTTRSYDVGQDQAWEIARTVFRWEGTDAIEEHRDQGFMLTSTSMDAMTFGTVMGAWIEPIDEGRTSVTVVTKRRVATNLVTSLTETTFHDRFAECVSIVKSGRPLPMSPPASTPPN